MEKNSKRVIDAVTTLCEFLIPNDVRREVDNGENLFSINHQVGQESVTLEISSEHRKIRGLIIGRNGQNIKAIRHLAEVIGYQEGFTLIGIAIVN